MNIVFFVISLVDRIYFHIYLLKSSHSPLKDCNTSFRVFCCPLFSCYWKQINKKKKEPILIFYRIVICWGTRALANQIPYTLNRMKKRRAVWKNTGSTSRRWVCSLFDTLTFFKLHLFQLCARLCRPDVGSRGPQRAAGHAGVQRQRWTSADRGKSLLLLLFVCLLMFSWWEVNMFTGWMIRLSAPPKHIFKVSPSMHLE